MAVRSEFHERGARAYRVDAVELGEAGAPGEDILKLFLSSVLTDGDVEAIARQAAFDVIGDANGAEEALYDPHLEVMSPEFCARLLVKFSARLNTCSTRLREACPLPSDPAQPSTNELRLRNHEGSIDAAFRLGFILARLEDVVEIPAGASLSIADLAGAGLRKHKGSSVGGRKSALTRTAYDAEALSEAQRLLVEEPSISAKALANRLSELFAPTPLTFERKIRAWRKKGLLQPRLAT